MRAEQVDVEVEVEVEVKVEVEVVRTQMTVRNPRAARKISRTICSAMAMILLSATPRSSEAFTASSTSISTSASMSAYGSVNGNVKAAFSPFERSSSFTTGSSTRTTMTGRGRNAAAPTSTCTCTCTSTQLQMSLSTAMAPLSTATGVAAVFGALSGGLFSGSLHAISGPDHLAALVPKCCGQRWYKAGKIGILWGMGHGVSATLLGIMAFFLKNRLPEKMGGLLHGASSTMEIAIGISLILIGVLGIRESREWEEDEVQTNFKSLSAAAAPASMELDNGAVSAQSKRAVVFNGLLHGFSWDGAPSLAPALTVATWRGSLTFLFSYALGTMAAMALATVAIGEGTRKAGEIMHRPDIPQKVSFVSSWVAIAVGLFWCKLAVF